MVGDGRTGTDCLAQDSGSGGLGRGCKVGEEEGITVWEDSVGSTGRWNGCGDLTRLQG